MNVEFLLLHAKDCDTKMSDGWRLMMERGRGKRKRLQTTEQITPNNTMQKVLELAHAQVLENACQRDRVRGVITEKSHAEKK